MQTSICPTCGCSLVRLGIKSDNAVSCIYNSKEYKFCCRGCVDVFLANPEPLLAETQDLVVCPTCLAEKQRESTIHQLFDGTELHFCRCPACLVLFRKKPDYYLARLAGEVEYRGVFTEEERCCAAT